VRTNAEDALLHNDWFLREDDIGGCNGGTRGSGSHRWGLRLLPTKDAEDLLEIALVMLHKRQKRIVGEGAQMANGADTALQEGCSVLREADLMEKPRNARLGREDERVLQRGETFALDSRTVAGAVGDIAKDLAHLRDCVSVLEDVVVECLHHHLAVCVWLFFISLFVLKFRS